jgi:hypothetical protein
MITTKNIQLTPKKYFSIMINRYIRQRWWLYAFLWLITILLSLIKVDMFTIFMLCFSVLYPLAIIFTYKRYAKSNDNKIAFIEKHYQIDETTLTSYLSDGTSGTIKLQNIIKTVKAKDCFLLFISKGQFYYFPYNSFNSEDDFQTFKKYISAFVKVKF